MAVDSGRKATWYGRFYETKHSDCMKRIETLITTWSFVSTGYKVLFLFYICINICAQPTIMMPARGNPDVTQHVHVTQVNMNDTTPHPPNPRRDEARACDAS